MSEVADKMNNERLPQLELSRKVSVDDVNPLNFGKEHNSDLNSGDSHPQSLNSF